MIKQDNIWVPNMGKRVFFVIRQSESIEVNCEKALKYFINFVFVTVVSIMVIDSYIIHIQQVFLIIQKSMKMGGTPIGIYFFKVSNKNTLTMFEISLKLTTKAPERRHDVVLVSLLLTLNRFYTLFWSLYS